MTKDEAVSKLVLANRILSKEGVLEAFGHVSMRNSENSEEFLLSCSRAPEMVSEDAVNIGRVPQFTFANTIKELYFPSSWNALSHWKEIQVYR